MKFVLIAILALVATNAQAATRKVEKETIICDGIEESKGYKLVLKAKSQSNVEEKAIAYWATLDQPDGMGYEGLIFGYKSDVYLNLRPKRNGNVQVSGTIYMDDAEQELEYEIADGTVINLHLNCHL